MRLNKYRKGDWKAVCDACGFDFYASELRLRWDGMRVCRDDWEPRHPQDFLRGRRDDQTVPWTRPPGTDQQITVNPLDPDDVTYTASDVDSWADEDGSYWADEDGATWGDSA